MSGVAGRRLLLAVETSCDETAAAVVDDTLEVRSSVVASQIDLHAAFGGVVPELASRAHVEMITAIVERALAEAGVSTGPTWSGRRHPRPGLVGALLVGIATAKALALGWGVPLVGVNHLEGHLASVYLADREVPSPRSRSSCRVGTACSPGPPSRATTSCWAKRSTTPSVRPTTRWPVSSGWATPAAPCSTAWRRRGATPGFPAPDAAPGLHLLLLRAQDRGGQLRAGPPGLRLSEVAAPSWPRAWTCSSPSCDAH